jgi:4-hydroxy-tetrahydrodipicolinate synthase
MSFKGVYTALVTPFAKDGSVDWEALERLIDFQLENRVDGLVPVGTTGESPTLNNEEHLKVIETVTRKAQGRCKVIAGTGANSTAEAVELTQAAKDLGVDGTLQVTPYYNKPTQAGLIQHFTAVADLGLPVVLYNVPGRSGRAIDIETVATLSAHPSVVSVKEAGGSVDRVSAIKAVCDIEVVSGDDSLALPMISVGACGVISVASNVMPGRMVEMIHAALNGAFDRARALHLNYYKLFGDLFLETNPIPVKAALAEMGRIEEVYRLPLCRMSEDHRAVLCASLKAIGLI